MTSLNNIGPVDNKSICNGLGCFNEATTKIDEEIGDMGRIKLQLCNDCLLKFWEQ